MTTDRKVTTQEARREADALDESFARYLGMTGPSVASDVIRSLAEQLEEARRERTRFADGLEWEEKYHTDAIKQCDALRSRLAALEKAGQHALGHHDRWCKHKDGIGALNCEWIVAPFRAALAQVEQREEPTRDGDPFPARKE